MLVVDGRERARLPRRRLSLSAQRAEAVGYCRSQGRIGGPGGGGFRHPWDGIQDRNQSRKHPVDEVSREDMFHVLAGHLRQRAARSRRVRRQRLAEWLGPSSPKITLDHYAHFMPEAGRRGLASMGSWLAPSSRERKPPEKSLAALPSTNLSLKPLVTEVLREAADVKVTYKETARRGLAVNVIEC